MGNISKRTGYYFGLFFLTNPSIVSLEFVCSTGAFNTNVYGSAVFNLRCKTNQYLYGINAAGNTSSIAGMQAMCATLECSSCSPGKYPL